MSHVRPWILFTLLLVGYAVAPLLLQLLYVSTSDWHTLFLQLDLDALFTYFSSQAVSLVVLAIFNFFVVRRGCLASIVAAVLFVPLAPVHAWVCTWIMFAGQYNRELLSGQVLVAVLLATVGFAILLQVGVAEHYGGGEQSDESDSPIEHFEN